MRPDRMHHSQHYVANRMFAIHGCTLNHQCNFPIGLHQIRTHNTANNRWDVNNSRILRDTQIHRAAVGAVAVLYVILNLN